ncbi:MAG: Ig-like domain-containing protein, partial [Flammeovirgaceae bacterium]
IHINLPPVAVDDSFSIVQGGTATFNLVSNDADADGTLLMSSLSILAQPTNGTLVDNGDGTVTYTHDGSASPLSDGFQYTIADDENDTSNVATVHISIIPVTTGLGNSNTLKQIKVYPNPTLNLIHFSSATNNFSNIKEIRVLDILGKTIYKRKRDANSYIKPIDLTEFETGMYFIHLYGKHTSQSIKVIKK